jgi:hypothetical protein
MTPVAVSLISGAFLTVVLLLVWRSARLPGQISSDAFFAGHDWSACPDEFVSEIFTPDDWEFVAAMNSPPLKELFLKERACVARAWIRHTSGSIRHIMREHLQLSRRSADLEIGAELQIYATYALLQTACVALLVSLEFAGPVRLRTASLQLYRLSERFTQAHGAHMATLESAPLQGASQV